jgi:hypothetical protein
MFALTLLMLLTISFPLCIFCSTGRWANVQLFQEGWEKSQTVDHGGIKPQGRATCTFSRVAPLTNLAVLQTSSRVPLVDAGVLAAQLSSDSAREALIMCPGLLKSITAGM